MNKHKRFFKYVELSILAASVDIFFLFLIVNNSLTFRLDQTLGKPGVLYSNGKDRERVTLSARIVRMENQVGL